MSAQNDVDMYKNDMVTRRYSEGFKLKILAELSTGNYSKKQPGTIDGINRTTINERIKKYDRKDLMNTRIMIENQYEMVNGILKDEFYSGQCFSSTAHARLAAINAIKI